MPEFSYDIINIYTTVDKQLFRVTLSSTVMFQEDKQIGIWTKQKLYISL